MKIKPLALTLGMVLCLVATAPAAVLYTNYPASYNNQFQVGKGVAGWYLAWLTPFTVLTGGS